MTGAAGAVTSWKTDFHLILIINELTKNRKWP
jgi:hypothetical protein